jgi:hypothetical protein
MSKIVLQQNLPNCRLMHRSKTAALLDHLVGGT